MSHAMQTLLCITVAYNGMQPVGHVATAAAPIGFIDGTITGRAPAKAVVAAYKAAGAQSHPMARAEWGGRRGRRLLADLPPTPETSTTTAGHCGTGSLQTARRVATSRAGDSRAGARTLVIAGVAATATVVLMVAGSRLAIKKGGTDESHAQRAGRGGPLVLLLLSG